MSNSKSWSLPRRLLNHPVSQKLLRKVLQLQYTVVDRKSKVEYPPPRINFDVLFISARLSTYVRQFSGDEEQQHKVRFVAEAAKLDYNSKILDFGAGLGPHLLAFKRAGIPFKQLVA